MPQFSPGETKTALASMTNPQAKSFAYTAELYLGLPKAASSGVISFSLAAGETRNIAFPVRMPSAEGTFPIYLDVFSNEQLVGAYQAVEDVKIVPPPPVYKGSVDFRREAVCAGGYMWEGVWICTDWFPSEREGFVTVTNEGGPGSLTTLIEGYMYLEGTWHSVLSGTHKQWTDYFDVGQVRTYKIRYMVPVTGMAFDSRFFIKVLDPNGEVIAEKAYTTSL